MTEVDVVDVIVIELNADREGLREPLFEGEGDLLPLVDDETERLASGDGETELDKDEVTETLPDRDDVTEVLGDEDDSGLLDEECEPVGDEDMLTLTVLEGLVEVEGEIVLETEPECDREEHAETVALRLDV